MLDSWIDGGAAAPGANAAPLQSLAALPERVLNGSCRITPGNQLPRAALIVSRSELVVASTAEGSYPQCAMQLAHRGSLPRP